MDFSHMETGLPLTEPAFPKETTYLVEKLKKKKAAALAKMMNLSRNLAELNEERYAAWGSHQYQQPEPAAFVFSGDVYRGLDIRSFSQDTLAYAQERLRMLSGLYGILRPLDQIRPYRLEMGTKFTIKRNTNTLYKYWDNKITESVQQLADSDDGMVVNLASNEYAKVIDWKQLDATVITPSFLDNKNGTYKALMTYAKQCRGAMAAFIMKERISTPEHLQAFDWNGYVFNPDLSEEGKPVFTRG